MRGLWGRYLSLLAARPLPTKMATATTAALIGDGICQALEGSWRFDVERAARFSGWALASTVPVHYWYRGLHAKVASPLLRTAADQFLYAPPATAAFLFCMGFGAQGSGADPSAGGLKRVANLPRVLTENWLVWIPVQLVNFCFVPLPLQVAFGNLVGVAWSVRLSALGQASDDKLA